MALSITNWMIRCCLLAPECSWEQAGSRKTERRWVPQVHAPEQTAYGQTLHAWCPAQSPSAAGVGNSLWKIHCALIRCILRNNTSKQVVPYHPVVKRTKAMGSFWLYSRKTYLRTSTRRHQQHLINKSTARINYQGFWFKNGGKVNAVTNT